MVVFISWCLKTGQKPGLVDFMSWPFNERLMAFDQLYELVKPAIPNLVTYFERMESTPAVQATISPKDHHIKFLMGKVTKNYVYDIPENPSKL